ncbi:hypothetical protein OSTOST_21964 [Ostertagia ostertagi]
MLTYVTLISATYTIPYYTMMSPVLIWFAIRWSQQLKVTKLKMLTKSHSKENDSVEELAGKEAGVTPPVYEEFA